MSGTSGPAVSGMFGPPAAAGGLTNLSSADGPAVSAGGSGASAEASGVNARMRTTAGGEASESRAAPRVARNAAPSSGLAAARAAAAGARNAAARQAAARGAAGSGWSDGSPTEEAPYDPEYDGPPPRGGAAYEGFDPGDEPLDEVIDEKTARESSEQQAFRLLHEALGAEKIGEV